ncbi:hypothetical protein [Streptomyces lydicus]|uniref:hypothetical protein n=1 Tax=Streptomyces lydicus TaxID=47763 RepID=UPI00378EEC79
MSDRRVAAIPLTDCGEDLVDVRDHGLKVDARKQDAAGAFDARSVTACANSSRKGTAPSRRHSVR